MAGLLLPLILNSKIIIPVVIFCIFTTNYIIGHYAKISITNNLISASSSTWHGLTNRFKNKNWLKQNFDFSMNFIKEQVSFPDLSGTTDIYSFNQAHLIASKMTWSPRPVFQSYSVFSLALAKNNMQHLLAYQPENIIFRIEPIDERVPSLEDGLSWPALLKNYQPTHFIKDFLFLRRKMQTSTAITMKLIKKEVHFLDEVVLVPDIHKLLFTQIDIKPTFLGNLALIFFKTSPLLITFELKNGIKKSYRLVANMAEAGFMLSPLIDDTKEFALLYNNKQLLNDKQVKSISITARQNKLWYWQNHYVIYFKLME